MNETTHPDRLSDVPWPTSDPRTRVPDTSMLPGSEKAPPPGVGLLKTAVQGAHNTLDRLADGAEPTVRQLSDRVSAAAETLHVKTDQLRNLGQDWTANLRTTVRDNPLMAIAAAAALGAVIASITRGRTAHGSR